MSRPWARLLSPHPQKRAGQLRGSADAEIALRPPAVDLAQDFYVLLRHRLLPQPGGFEGCFNLGPVHSEHFDSRDSPAAHLVREKRAILNPGIAAGHPARHTSQGDHLVPPANPPHGNKPIRDLDTAPSSCDLSGNDNHSVTRVVELLRLNAKLKPSL